jgi:hypothetical protein
MAQSPLGATRFWQGRTLRGADPPRLIEEPAELITQKRQGPPEGGHEHGARWLLGGKAVEQTVASGAPEIVLAATAVRTARQMWGIGVDRGGMSRVWLRGRDNVQKRYLIHVAGYNLGF